MTKLGRLTRKRGTEPAATARSSVMRQLVHGRADRSVTLARSHRQSEAMKLVTLVHSTWTPRLRAAVGELKVCVCGDSQTFCDALASGVGDVAFVDPGLVTPAQQSTVREAIQRTAIPVVIWTDLRPGAAAFLLDIVAAGARQILIRDFEDSSENIRRIVDALPLRSCAVTFLEEARSSLSLLPLLLRMPVIRLFTDQTIQSSKDLCCIVGAPRRSIDRWFLAARQKPSAWWVSAARILRTLSPLEAGVPLCQVLCLHNFGTRRSFRRQVAALTGLSVVEFTGLAAGDGSRIVRLLAQGLKFGGGI